MSPASRVLVTSLLVLGGCASYHPQPLRPDQTQHAFFSRSLHDPNLQRAIRAATGAPPPTVWDFPSLMLVASYYHAQIRLAQAQWRTAQAGLVAAGARPNPSIATSAQYDRDAVEIPPWTIALDLRFTIETAGKRDDRIAQARAQAEAAQCRVAAAAWEVASALRRHLLALYHAQQSRLILQRLETIQTRYVAQLEKRHAIGDLSSFALAQMRVALDTTRLQIRTADAQVGAARSHIADALGVPVDALTDVDFSLVQFDHPALAGRLPGLDLRTRALQHRPDILAALADYAASEAALKLEVARQYPNLALGPGFTWDQGQRKWGLALGFPLPFNRNRGGIAVAQAQRDESAARFIALQNKVAGDLAAAQTAYVAALKRLDTANDLLATREAELRAMRARLRPGILSSGGLFNAEIAQSQSALSRLDALVQAQAAFGQLEDAAQQPLDPLELPALPREPAR